jgi:hypothetical protein
MAGSCIFVFQKDDSAMPVALTTSSLEQHDTKSHGPLSLDGARITYLFWREKSGGDF